MPMIDYSQLQTVLFDLDGTLLEGLGPYETSLEQAVQDIFKKQVKVDLFSFHGLTDRGILYLTLQQQGHRVPLRNQNPAFEEQMTTCLKKFGEVYQANPKETNLLPGVSETLYKMILDENRISAAVVTGNVEEMARKKLALFEKSEDDEKEKLEYQGLNLHFDFGVFGNQSYYRENLIALAIQEIEKRRLHFEERDFLIANSTKQEQQYQECLRKIERKSLLGRIFLNTDKLVMPSLDSDELQREDFNRPINDIYIVGDTTQDINAGLKARELYTGKIYTVGVLSGEASSEELHQAGADYILNNLIGLPEIISNKVKKAHIF